MTEPAVVADGVDHRLDPRVIPLQRITGAIFTALIAAGIALGARHQHARRDDDPDAHVDAAAMVWLVLVLLLAWHSYRWPPRRV